jgi:hypothetical protein
MPTDEPQDQPDPSEVQPTDNSSGVPVDLERLEDIEAPESPPSWAPTPTGVPFPR